MADKGSFPEGFAIPLLPKSRKRKLSRSTSCIICQTDRPGEPLRKAKEDSIEKAIKATEQRRDEEVRARFVSHDADTGIHWHSTCYASYTSDQNIHYKTPSDALQHTSRQNEVDVISNRTFRSAMAQLIGRGVSFVKKGLIKRVKILSIYAHSRPVKASE